ncbi:unnamed protein product [Rotaria sp. Silwood2]|nr:unnamed protein product [Rotaria sp. Silwood2]CAF4281722.1 unnamed protein product [Rotaria sp. Silwood2]
MSLDYFLWKTGEYDKAQVFFSMILTEERSLDHTTTSLVYNNLSVLYSDQSRYKKKTLKNYLKSISCEMKNQHPNYFDIATNFNNIDIIYANKNKNKAVLKYYKEALKIKIETTNPKQEKLADIATTYSNVGCVYVCQEQF